MRLYNTIELLGDVDVDEDMDAFDAMTLADVLLEIDLDPRHRCAADLIGDENLNGLDLQTLVVALQ